LQGEVEAVIFGIMIIILLVAWGTLLRKLKKAFGDAMRNEKRLMG